MKLIKPSFEIFEQGFGIDSIYKHIELCGRTCYKSTDKITNNSAKPFVERMIKSKHYAMLEHGTVYLKIPYNILHRVTHPGLCSKYLKNPYSRCSEIEEYNEYFNFSNKYLLVTTNLRVIIENGWTKDLQYICEPTNNHIKRYTVKFICNRQVSHEFVRHRVFSFAQESTRYCNYAKCKFGKQLTFIDPCWNTNNAVFLDTLECIENHYLNLINNGWKPQQAANILPNSIKTELIMTGFVDDSGWKHFFDLRAKGLTGAPHPQAKELAEPLMKEFIKRDYLTNYTTN